MSGRKPFRFAAVMALMAFAVVAAGFLGTDSAGPQSDFEWSAPVSAVSVLIP
ncbi:hypothetical protein [Micromonospora sagamiensis]|uniref:Uncharacterized protein n=1 Tax=Micromonospora sagamiensis TaxID=47875 RepID=A0A562WAN7_9ACTN|nr:hypothetical protein [Micromonospora sagamiensis]TWJ27051.1 hypothetical protein JD81_00534 [Micromonospora sagamiensis]BCL14058.1 hypothetical protein GCM10017556_17970 [Micromonospora sagamiensis]